MVCGDLDGVVSLKIALCVSGDGGDGDVDLLMICWVQNRDWL